MTRDTYWHCFTLFGVVAIIAAFWLIWAPLALLALGVYAVLVGTANST